MIENETKLPPSWISCKLGDLINYGYTSKAEPTQMRAESWLLELEDIEKDTSKLIKRSTVSDRKPKSTKNKFKQGQILYGKLRPYLNKVVIADYDGYCSTEIVPLPECKHVDQRYLFYWLKSPAFLDYTDQVSHGINMPRLGTKAGNDAPFILAPLNEQVRIAEKLDTLLSAIETCKKKLRNSNKILQKFRQSVLTEAVSGELTREWREANNAPDWQRCNLSDLIDGSPQNGLYKPQSAYGSGCKILRIDDFNEGKIKNWENLKRLELEGEDEANKYKLETGDIVINRVNSITHLGKTALIGNLAETCVFESNMMRLSLKRSKASPAYINMFLNSRKGVLELRKNAKHAVNQASINQKDVCSININLPYLDEQHQIIELVKERFNEIENMSKSIAKASSRVEKLHSSILAKAFRGELLPQDPNDEPAAELLERIKAQREAEAATKKPAKRARKKKTDAAQLGIAEGIADNHLAKVLEECGALSELALIAASELQPEVFQLQLAKELNGSGLKQVDLDGKAAYADAAWEEEL